MDERQIPPGTMAAIMMRRLGAYAGHAIHQHPEPERTLLRTAVDLEQWQVAFGEVNGVEAIGVIVDDRPLVWVLLPRFDPDNVLGWRDP
jgi:hypothetical protein